MCQFFAIHYSTHFEESLVANQEEVGSIDIFSDDLVGDGDLDFVEFSREVSP